MSPSSENSSGGNSVMSHIVSPGSAGLFDHGVALSGAAALIAEGNFGASPSIRKAEEMGSDFAREAGCAENASACLRALPVADILTHQGDYIVNQAIIDGAVLPMPYRKALELGEFNRIPFVIGSTLDEWRWAVGFGENATGHAMNDEDYLTGMNGYYGEEIAQKVMEAYPLDEYQSPSEAYSAATTASLFACPGFKIAELASKYVPVYMYEFADRTAPSYLEPTTIPLGAAHTYELAYIFEGFHGGAGLPTRAEPASGKAFGPDDRRCRRNLGARRD